MFLLFLLLHFLSNFHLYFLLVKEILRYLAKLSVTLFNHDKRRKIFLFSNWVKIHKAYFCIFVDGKVFQKWCDYICSLSLKGKRPKINQFIHRGIVQRNNHTHRAFFKSLAIDGSKCSCPSRVFNESLDKRRF